MLWRLAAGASAALVAAPARLGALGELLWAAMVAGCGGKRSTGSSVAVCASSLRQALHPGQAAAGPRISADRRLADRGGNGGGAAELDLSGRLLKRCHGCSPGELGCGWAQGLPSSWRQWSLEIELLRSVQRQRNVSACGCAKRGGERASSLGRPGLGKGARLKSCCGPSASPECERRS